jgi:Major Facilitator Superfamily
MFFALQLDRGNISQALSDNMLDDLGLNTNDYNYGQAIFYFAFLTAELPSQLISKWIGPDRWLPIQMIAWSIVASLQAFLTGRGSFYLTRALIGMIEGKRLHQTKYSYNVSLTNHQGGFIPDNVLYLSYFYTGSELPARLSWFWVSSQTTNIISAFLAFGILHLRGLYGLAGWRWLFAIEGCITGIIGVMSFFYLPPSPTQTPGWFTVHEEKIMVNRILRDDPSKGGMHNRQALSLQMVKDCLTDWHMFPIYLIAICFQIPTNPMTAYLTLQLRSIGFDTFQTNLLSIPAYILFICQLLFWTWFSEKINDRFLTGLASQIWALPLLLVLEWMPVDANVWAKYAVTALLVGHPYVHAILVGITSRNAGTVRTRTVASALYNMSVQASAIISQNVSISL